MAKLLWITRVTKGAGSKAAALAMAQERLTSTARLTGDRAAEAERCGGRFSDEFRNRFRNGVPAA